MHVFLFSAFQTSEERDEVLHGNKANYSEPPIKDNTPWSAEPVSYCRNLQLPQLHTLYRPESFYTIVQGIVHPIC